MNIVLEHKITVPVPKYNILILFQHLFAVLWSQSSLVGTPNMKLWIWLDNTGTYSHCDFAYRYWHELKPFVLHRFQVSFVFLETTKLGD